MDHNWVNMGAYWSNTALSQEVLDAAQPHMTMLDYVDEMEAKGQVGETLAFPKEYDLDSAYETQSIPENGEIPLSGSTHNQGSLTIREFGRGTTVSEKLTTLSFYDAKAIAEGKLKRNMARTINQFIARQFKRTFYRYSPTDATAANVGTLKTDGTAPGAALRSLNATDLIYLKNYMADTLNVPSWGGEGSGLFQYILVGTQTLLSQLMRDTEIKQDLRDSYAGLAGECPLIKGSFGIWNGILFKLENESLATMISTTMTGQAFMFGDRPVVMRTALKPEIRYEEKDFGRLKKIAWYGMFGASPTWGTDSTDTGKNQGRIINVTALANPGDIS